MAGDKRVMEYGGPEAFGLKDVNGKSVAATTGSKVIRLNRPHAVLVVIDIANQNDDGTAGGLMDLQFDLYDEAGANIIWSGDIATAIPIHVDLKAGVLFGGGVSAAASDGTIAADADVLAIFNKLVLRVDVTVASNDTGTCLINLRALVQE